MICTRIKKNLSWYSMNYYCGETTCAEIEQGDVLQNNSSPFYHPIVTTRVSRFATAFDESCGVFGDFLDSAQRQTEARFAAFASVKKEEHAKVRN